MNCIKETGIIDENTLKDIRELLKNNTDPPQTSLLYSTQKKEKLVDTDIRKSNFKLLTDNQMFQLFEKL